MTAVAQANLVEFHPISASTSKHIHMQNHFCLVVGLLALFTWKITYTSNTHSTNRHTHTNKTPNMTKLNLICMKLLTMGRNSNNIHRMKWKTHQNNYSNFSKNVIYIY